MLNPGASFARVSADDRRWPIEIEASTPWPLHPSALRDEPSLYNFSLPWRPCHLLDRLVLVEPAIGFDGHRLAVFLKDWTPVCIYDGLRRNTGIDTARWPKFAARCENVRMQRHVRLKIFERDSYGCIGRDKFVVRLSISRRFAIRLFRIPLRRNTPSGVSKLVIKILGKGRHWATY
jgi:hypothetical protein